MIDQHKLKLFLDYDRKTGIFTRRIRTSNRIAVGDVAGSPDKKGYLCIRVLGKTYKAHRLAWLYETGAWPENEIDHINGIVFDNRIENLRDVSKSINQQNRRGTKGYSRDGYRWKAQIRVGGNWKHLGCYETESEAHQAYISAKAEMHVPAMKARKQ